ncbi:MAG: sugar phosphate isomerase/epimerase [Opitutae bacterium]|nr:sugar phosphate isomerase/epimerase [Opitutae bacterium]
MVSQASNPPRQFRPGLTSVTFRRLSVETIAREAADAGLQVIEWGGDVHAPPGDLARAGQIRALSQSYGLSVTYGSYYRLGERDPASPAFSAVVESALALGATTIRTWAGRRGSADADADYWRRVVDDAHEAAALASAHQLSVSLERHCHTLTDRIDAHCTLLERLPLANVYTYWQPDATESVAANAASLRRVLPRLTNVHVFNFQPPSTFLPLGESAAAWHTYLAVLRDSPRPHDFMLEFVQDDSLDAFRRDAADLCSWLATA